jgi:ribonucleoside-diphosphate reductase alpha chain
MNDNIYERLSERRKVLQAEGLVPDWYTTGGLQLFEAKYEYQTAGRSVRGQFERIASTAASYLKGTKYEAQAYDKFFELMWNGWLSLSTPVMANTGTTRGLSVSCSGTYVDDSIDGFYSNLREVAILTKNGFGTASYLGNIRPRGSKISAGGKASGVLPVMKDHIRTMSNVSQGSSRRGAWAGYIEITHGDFDELVDFTMAEPDDCNLGWIITDKFIADLNAGDAEAIRRFQRVMKLKMVTGRGYFCFIDKANRKRPKMYVDKGLTVKSFQLCNEISLFSDKDHTYTCVLSSMNVSKWEEWKDTDAVFWATVFLDCIAEDFIQHAKKISGLEKAVRFTEKGRALGLGQAGLHTLFQKKRIPFESIEAFFLSTEIAENIAERSLLASQDMAKELGEPEWCVGYGVRNTHLLAAAPTKSSALLIGGVSEGINPDPAMTYTQNTAAGDMDRITPILYEVMKERGVYNKKTITDITSKMGSVQHVDWLDDHEKLVFRTAFEMNQEAILRMAAQRGNHIDQWQSLNLFFSSDADPAEIARVHQMAFEDERILGLYYVYSKSGVQAATECIACQ